MNIAVIGLGSMGQRRIRLLREIDSSINIYGIDINLDKCKAIEIEYQIKTSCNLSTLLCQEHVDTVIVSCDPITHYEMIYEAINHNCNVFTEINIVSMDVEGLQQLAKEKNITLFISSTMLYRKETKYIKDVVRENEFKVCYNYHVGQYLPDWHPWESYKDFFVGNKQTNACREIMAIEFPWLADAFGDISSITVKSRKISSLVIDYPDSIHLIIEHKSGVIGTMSIDVVSRWVSRNFEMIGEKVLLSWDGTPEGLKSFDLSSGLFRSIDLYSNILQIREKNKTIIENAYRDELLNFFRVLSGVDVPMHSFEKDAHIIAIIDSVEAQYADLQ